MNVMMDFYIDVYVNMEEETSVPCLNLFFSSLFYIFFEIYLIISATYSVSSFSPNKESVQTKRF